jgi:hypothetical protein
MTTSSHALNVQLKREIAHSEFHQLEAKLRIQYHPCAPVTFQVVNTLKYSNFQETLHHKCFWEESLSSNILSDSIKQGSSNVQQIDAS